MSEKNRLRKCLYLGFLLVILLVSWACEKDPAYSDLEDDNKIEQEIEKEADIISIDTIDDTESTTGTEASHEGIDFIELTYDIDTGHFKAVQPDVFNGTVIWTGDDERVEYTAHSDLRLYEYHLDRGMELVAESRTGGQLDSAQMNENWIVWVDWLLVDEGEWLIQAYSKETKETKEIARHTVGKHLPLMHLPYLSLSNSDYLAWLEKVEEGGDEKYEVNVMRLPEGLTNTVAIIDLNNDLQDKLNNDLLYVSDEDLIWSDDTEIYVYSLKEESIVEQITAPRTVISPKANNRYVVWEEYYRDATMAEMFIQPLGGEGERMRIRSGKVFSYDIGEDYVIWETNNRIQLYSIEHRKTQLLGPGKLPHMRNNEAVWSLIDDDQTESLRYAKFRE
ncbi:hypothetical protein [Bacillus horti]|uniref:WD40 repeat domain-containing protein n=1 Tax=Caldalkalibacillus horti TaxID=77523 RepID=A0ABT9W3C5_9BACI|nr:hypothetical protein [Bacillus horti]MDQ0167758.1 hypothetical protein [Bacillus horti]